MGKADQAVFKHAIKHDGFQDGLGGLLQNQFKNTIDSQVLRH